jgi:glycosyltransferase involved in cell wall biosynthesis
MRITLVNQAFYPDIVSSGQHLTDLALALAQRGHEVTVLSSQRAYDDPQKVFAKLETWNGIRIHRLFSTGFGKRAKWRRSADFASFICSACRRLFFLPRQDLVVAMTSPPLISFVAACFARLRGWRFCYWVMDMNPDEALAAGWLRQNSLAARWLEWCSRFSLRSASAIIVLDRFMRDRILNKGVEGQKVAVIPPWSHDAQVCFDIEGRTRFRDSHGLANKFVVMYSGNHSPCHPLDTILGAAEKLAGRDDVAFCFVGGGSEFSSVQQFARDRNLSNILCLPYQPMSELAGSLSAADLHLVLMGDLFVGLVHPCKIYNIIRVGAPLLYIGPEPSHVSDILQRAKGDLVCAQARHGQIDQVVQAILRLKEGGSRLNRDRGLSLANCFSEERLLRELLAVLESAGKHEGREVVTGDAVSVQRRDGVETPIPPL